MNINNDKITPEQIVQAFNYSKNLLDTVTVSGAENCKKISVIYSNIETFLNILAQGNMEIVEKDSKTK